MESQESSQSSTSTKVPTPPSSGDMWRPKLDLSYHSESPSSSKQSVTELTTTQRNPRDILIELIQTVEPEFDKDKRKKQAMWQAQKPLHQLKKTARFKMKTTLSKAVKASISALSKCKNDHGAIYTYVKESGCIEKEVGQKAMMDSHIREVIRAHNKNPDPKHRVQCISLVSKLGFGRLRKFNPPPVKKVATEPIEPNPVTTEDVMDVDSDDDLFPNIDDKVTTLRSQ